jgi:DNA-binding transcriptional ArsR family regulator
MAPEPSRPRSYASLARNLEALGSEPRLELLRALRRPQIVSDIRITQASAEEGDRGRVISRQGITRHLDVLLDAGLVSRAPSESKAHGDTYVLNHERLFAIVDEIRGLARLRPILSKPAEPGETMDKAQAAELKLPPTPRLLVAYGRDDGVAHGLAGLAGTKWRIGRAATCEICLDYDPYLSAEHCVVERAEGAFLLRDAGSRNGTWVNWVRLRPDAPRVLAPGDLVAVGRSLLVFQP